MKTLKNSNLWKQAKRLLVLLLLAVSLGVSAQSECSKDFIGSLDMVADEVCSSDDKGFRLIGKVVNEGNMPISGVTVWVKGTSKGIMTDEEGKFVLRVKPGEELQISHVVYHTRNIVVKDDTPLIVKMVEYIRNLSEMVVVGRAPEKSEVIEVTGKVFDLEDGWKIIGAAIQTPDGKYRAISDMDGAFKIKAEVGKAIQISYLGQYVSWVVVKDTMPLTVYMKDIEDLPPYLWFVPGKVAKKIKAEKKALDKERKKLRKELKAIPEKSGVADKKAVFQVVEQMPEFPGGMGECMKFLACNLKYPLEAQKVGIRGRMHVEFVVCEDGQVSDIKTGYLGTGLDAEVLRVMNMMPKWNPGKQRGKAVSVKYVLPIVFKLETPTSEKDDVKL